MIKNLLKNRKLLIIFLAIIIVIYIGYRVITRREQSVQYQTATAEKSTLIVSISSSGTVSSANSASVNTQATGVVSRLDVQNGDQVIAGQEIAQIDLDLEGQQRASQTLASYESAKNNLASAQASLFSLQSTMFTKWKTYMDTAQNTTYQNSDGSPNISNRQLPQFMSTNDDWLAAEAVYKNQQGVVTQTQTALNSAWLSYQQSSSIIYAPISGKITGLSLQPGSVIASSNSNSTSTSSTSSQSVANIVTDAMPTVEVDLTEIDVPKVKVGDQVTMTFDAFADKTFAGHVVSINTVGIVNSDVTSYPVTIAFDTAVSNIYPNMSATAKIITKIDNDVLLVPLSAVQAANGQSTVRVLKNGLISTINVTTGDSNDSQIVITSGLKEGDTVITSIISNNNSSSGSTSSPFGAFGGGNRGFGGAALRINGR